LRRTLPLFIFVLILVFQSINMQCNTWTENKNFEVAIQADALRKGEVNRSDNNGIYRDGVVDNFNNFKNPGFPIEKCRINFRSCSAEPLNEQRPKLAAE